MGNPVAELAAELADLKRQIRELQTAPRATKTSVSGGYTRWLPANGAEYPKVYAGALETDKVGFFVDKDDGIDGELIDVDLLVGFVDTTTIPGIGLAAAPSIFAANPDHSLYSFATADGNILAPIASAPWVENKNLSMGATGIRYTTSGTFTEIARAIMPLHTNAISLGLTANPTSGATEMELQITARALYAVYADEGMTLNPTAQTVHTETGITTSTSISGPFEIPETLVSPSRNPTGLGVELKVLARVTAGTGNATVNPYNPVYSADPI